MNASSLRNSLTYPQGCLDFLTLSPERGHHIGDYEMQASGPERFDAVLRALSPESPSLALDQVATVAQRALKRYPAGQKPAFVTSRLDAMARFEALIAAAGWGADDELRGHLRPVQDYMGDASGLILNELPVVGRPDDAVLIDGSGRVRRLLSFSPSSSPFRPYRGRGHRTDPGAVDRALLQSRGGKGQRFGRSRYTPDPRATLFHVT